jgi:glycosyltransferase involved in cell wall biosynthesis
MRIGIVTQRVVRPDGQGRVNYEFARRLLDLGHTVICLCSELAPTMQQDPRVAWIPIRVGPWPTQLVRDQVFALRSTWALWRCRRQLDLVVVNGFITWWPAGLNLVHFVHSAWIRSPAHPIHGKWRPINLYRWLYSAINADLERIAFRRSRGLVAISAKVRRELLACGVPADKITVIPNGVDLESFSQSARDRRRFGLPDTAAVAAFAGDIRTTRKNLDTVLKVVARTSGLHLVVAGSVKGSPYPAMAAALGVADRVHFAGHCPDLGAVMNAADLFLFPSRYEPFGLVLLEASACGLPVVTAGTVGASEVLSPEASIIVEDPEDVAALTQAVARIVGDPALRRHMAAEARRAAERYPWSLAADRFCSLVASITASLTEIAR